MQKFSCPFAQFVYMCTYIWNPMSYNYWDQCRWSKSRGWAYSSSTLVLMPPVTRSCCASFLQRISLKFYCSPISSTSSEASILRNVNHHQHDYLQSLLFPVRAIFLAPAQPTPNPLQAPIAKPYDTEIAFPPLRQSQCVNIPHLLTNTPHTPSTSCRLCFPNDSMVDCSKFLGQMTSNRRDLVL